MTESKIQLESQRPVSIGQDSFDSSKGMLDPSAAPAQMNLALEARTFFNRQPPPQYLEEWVQRLAQPEEHIAQDLLSLVIFRLQDEYLAVRTRCLVEVTLPQPIHAIPHRTNDVVLGLVNIRGQLRICFSAHGLLGVALPDASQQTHYNDVSHAALHVTPLDRMLIVHERSEHWAFPVEEVLGVHRLPLQDLRPVPSTFGKAGAFSQAVFTCMGHTVGYLEETRFVSALRSACK